VVLRCELLAQGHTDRSIRRLLGRHVLVRVRHGAYVDAASWSACDELGRHGLVARAVLREARAPVALSHLSAAAEWEVPLWDTTLGAVHVTRLDGRGGRREAGVEQHVGSLRDEDVTELNGVVVTSPTRTALDCLALMDVEHGITVVNDLLHRGLTTADQLSAANDFMDQWPGTLNNDLVLRLADGRCGESVGEGRLLYLCFRASLPAPTPQYPIRDRNGRVFAYVDLAWPGLGVFVEFDGRVKYDGLRREGESVVDVVLREKRREERICELTGWRCIRITWADLYRPDETAARIRAVLLPGAA
jgi:hypothetical protein